MSQEGNNAGAQPSTKEAFFFLHIMGSMKNKPDVDWDIVAQKSGYSNGACAKTRFRQIKNRLGYTEDGAAPKSGGASKPRAAPKKANGSGTNKTGSKVKKNPTKSKKELVSKAEFAEAALHHVKEEDKYSVKNPGNPGIKEEDDTSAEYDEEGHAANIEAYGEDDDEDDDRFYDAPFGTEA